MLNKSNVFNANFTLNINGKLVDFDQPLVMGILNCTPDSFYKNSRIKNGESALSVAEKMIADGADILDIGGMSSRPNAQIIDTCEELDRVLPVIEAIHQQFPETILSIDTMHASVAQKAVEQGCVIVNDISGGSYDVAMLSTVAKLNVPYILMHMRGNPSNMQEKTNYENLINDVNFELSEKIALAKAAGIKSVIVDPGFGFSKTLSQNFEMLNHLEAFHIHQLPLLVGVSRKSMIYKTLNTTAANALNGSTALHFGALMKGACILRVHDVLEATEAIMLYKQMISSDS